MKLGIVGLPNVGKSTLFNAMTGEKAETATYRSFDVQPNLGVVKVPDSRLDWLAQLHQPDKVTPATIEFVDIAGLAKGEGLGNKYLAAVRQTDALIHVVRCFDNDEIFDEPADALRDVEILNMELVLADIEVVERRVEKARKNLKGGDKKYQKEAAFFEGLLNHLNEGNPARTYPMEEADLAYFQDGGILTLKKVIYVANLSEESYADLEHNANYQKLKAFAEETGEACMPICARLEMDIMELPEDERAPFLEDLGITEMGLSRLINCAYDLLGLMSFLTAGKPEVRAWTIRKGSKAPEAAGKIHSDIERGFIRAEVVSFDDLVKAGTMQAAKEKGLIRSEGKDYVMRDGDIVLFRFNVSK